MTSTATSTASARATSALNSRITVPAGLRRAPILTATVFAATAVTSLAQFVVPGMLAHLQRTPAELHGQWWRMLTSLFVQDGGLIGTLSNLAFLAIVGAAAEQTLSRPRWLLQYFGVGVLSELIGYSWDKVGGGNSIAVCGLTGAVAIALWRGDRRLPAYTGPAVLMWCGALLGTMSSALYIPAIIAGVAAVRLVRERADGGFPANRAVAAAVGVVTVVLAIARNIHGGALLVGIAVALIAVLAGAARARRGY